MNPGVVFFGEKKHVFGSSWFEDSQVDKFLFNFLVQPPVVVLGISWLCSIVKLERDP